MTPHASRTGRSRLPSLGPHEATVVGIVVILVLAGFGVFGGRPADLATPTAGPSAAALASPLPGSPAAASPEACREAPPRVDPVVRLVVAGGVGIPGWTGGPPGEPPHVVVPPGASLTLALDGGWCASGWSIEDAPGFEALLDVSGAAPRLVPASPAGGGAAAVTVLVTIGGASRAYVWSVDRMAVAVPRVVVHGPGAPTPATLVPCSVQADPAEAGGDAGCGRRRVPVALDAPLDLAAGDRLVFAATGAWTLIGGMGSCREVPADGRLASLPDRVLDCGTWVGTDSGLILVPGGTFDGLACAILELVSDGVLVRGTWCRWVQVR